MAMLFQMFTVVPVVGFLKLALMVTRPILFTEVTIFSSGYYIYVGY